MDKKPKILVITKKDEKNSPTAALESLGYEVEEISLEQRRAAWERFNQAGNRFSLTQAADVVVITHLENLDTQAAIDGTGNTILTPADITRQIAAAGKKLISYSDNKVPKRIQNEIGGSVQKYVTGDVQQLKFAIDDALTPKASPFTVETR